MPSTARPVPLHRRDEGVEVHGGEPLTEDIGPGLHPQRRPEQPRQGTGAHRGEAEAVPVAGRPVEFDLLLVHANGDADPPDVARGGRGRLHTTSASEANQAERTKLIGQASDVAVARVLVHGRRYTGEGDGHHGI